MSLIEKIDKALEKNAWGISTMKRPQYDKGRYDMAYECLRMVREIILAEQKEPCHGCKHKGKTIDQHPCNMCPRIYTDKFTPINQPQEGE